jgi:WD40 repeat protein
VSGARDNTVRLWDIETGTQVLVREQPRNMVTYIARAKGDEFVAQTSEDKELK